MTWKECEGKMRMRWTRGGQEGHVHCLQCNRNGRMKTMSSLGRYPQLVQCRRGKRGRRANFVNIVVNMNDMNTRQRAGEMLSMDCSAVMPSSSYSAGVNEHSDTVPIVDLKSRNGDFCNDDNSNEIDTIRRACSEWGFFHVINHGVDERLIAQFDDQCRIFFSTLPKDEKLRVKRRANNARGYFDDELTKQRRDWKEAIDIGAPYSQDWAVRDDDELNSCLDGFNQFPSAHSLPQFRSTMAEYFESMTQVAERVTELISLSLGEDRHYFRSTIGNEHTSYIRLNYYPPCPFTEEADHKKVHNSKNIIENKQVPLGISPHKDAGLITVLRQDDHCHSLQVRKRGQDKWSTVVPLPGAFTINIGDMMEIYSNSIFHAPEHRVLTNKQSDRYSAPFFYNPGYETKIAPIPSLGKPKFHNLYWGYYRAQRFAGDFADYGVEIQIDDFRWDSDSWHLQNQSRFMQKATFSAAFSCEKYRHLLTNNE